MNNKAVKNAPVQGTGANTKTASKINNRPNLTGKEAKNETHENKAPAQTPQVEETKAPETKTDSSVAVDNQPANLAEPPKAEQVKHDEPKQEQPKTEEAPKAEEPTKEPSIKLIRPPMNLEATIKEVNALHRRSIQRLNLITRMKQIEAFEVALAEDSDELSDNPYQGCKLIIKDDKNREFITTQPGLIRLVAQYIFNACTEKLAEIEANIVFPA